MKKTSIIIAAAIISVSFIWSGCKSNQPTASPAYYYQQDERLTQALSPEAADFYRRFMPNPNWGYAWIMMLIPQNEPIIENWLEEELPIPKDKTPQSSYWDNKNRGLAAFLTPPERDTLVVWNYKPHEEFNTLHSFSLGGGVTGILWGTNVRSYWLLVDENEFSEAELARDADSDGAMYKFSNGKTVTILFNRSDEE